jgi:hypothetical protein
LKTRKSSSDSHKKAPGCTKKDMNLKPEEETHAKDAMDTKEETYE